MRSKPISFAIFFTFLVVSFQNCQGVSTTSTLTTESTSSKDSSSANSSSSVAGGTGLSYGSARGATRTPSSSGSSGSLSGGSSTVSGGNSSSSGGGTCLGCSSGSSGGSSSSGGVLGSGGSSSGNLQITVQPKSQTLPEGAEFTVGITVQGGQPPYTYSWYKDGQTIPPMYGADHYEFYSTILDRIYKEGDYSVTVTDSKGTKLTSSKASIRMVTKACSAGDYWFPVSTQKNYPDVMSWFGDLFIYQQTKFFVSQYNPTISQMQSRYSRTLSYLGFGYFKLGSSVSAGQEFSIGCKTDVPTVHSVQCTKDTLNKCDYYQRYENTVTSYYTGGVDFKCRNGYLEYVRNTCKIVTPPPPEDTTGGGN
ncbi:MAG: hypothetical protein KDD45_01850 [Bdellovibrionales bacterium]|nr:hypothetical protein [Bdellovibrionales bacterium]